MIATEPNTIARLWYLLNGASATVTFPDGAKVKMGVIEAAEFMGSLQKDGWELADPLGVDQVSRG